MKTENNINYIKKSKVGTRFNIKRAQVVWMLNDKEASCILLENK